MNQREKHERQSRGGKLGMRSRWGNRRDSRTIRVWKEVAEKVSKEAGESGDRVTIASEAILNGLKNIHNIKPYKPYKPYKRRLP